jgi:nicotinic acid mononucleotide adenylyltransferase
MEFVLRRRPAHRRLAVFPGAFNPPTRAHEAMALAALAHAEEVVLTLAARMPHKQMAAGEAALRLDWMRLLADCDERVSVAVTDGGLFVEMAREARAAAGVDEVSIVCGRDAAERAIGWDYGNAPAFDEQLQEFSMLVAPRQGHIIVSGSLIKRVTLLDLDEHLQSISSTEARRLIEAGEQWQDLVPERIAGLVRTSGEPLA